MKCILCKHKGSICILNIIFLNFDVQRLHLKTRYTFFMKDTKICLTH